MQILKCKMIIQNVKFNQFLCRRKNSERGQVMVFSLIMTATILVLAIVVLTISSASGRSAIRAHQLLQARNLAEAGFERTLQELNADSDWTGVQDVAFGNGTYSITVVNVTESDPNRKRIIVTGAVPSRITGAASQTIELIAFRTGSGNSLTFAFAAQAGSGGLIMHMGSRVRGSIWSNGQIQGQSSAQNQIITGNATSAGANGRIERIQVNGSAAAHTLDRMIASAASTANTCLSSTIYADLWAPTRTGCTVSGTWTSQPIPPDPEPQDLPIDDEVVEELREAAESGGTLEGDLTIPGYVPTTLGPRVITGNLIIGTAANLTLTGTVSVLGNITIGNSASITTDPVIYENGVLTAVIVANGNVTAHQGSRFVGLSPILLIAATGNATLNNSVRGDNVLFLASPHGNADINNGAVVRQISASQIILRAFAEIPNFPSQVELRYGSEGGGSSVWRFEPSTWHPLPNS